MISGHSTSDALKILHEELKTEYDRYNQKRKSRTDFLWSWLTQKGFLVNGAHLIFLLVCSCLLIAAFYLLEIKEYWLLVQGVLMLILVFLNGILLHHDLQEDQCITHKKVTHLLDHIHELSTKGSWNQASFTQLHVPTSQSISLQWAIRDSEVVGLPECLMVEGDVILLRPGQNVSVKCSPLEDTEVCIRNFIKHQHSNTTQPSINPSLNLDQSTTTNSSQLQPFLVLETPFLSIFRDYLRSCDVRVCSQLEKTRHRILNRLYHQKFLPLILSIMFLVNLLRYTFLPSYTAPLAYMLIVLQVQCIFPLLPTIYPLCWRLVDLAGVCQLSLFHQAICQDPLGTHPLDTTWSVLRCFNGHTPLLSVPLNTTHVIGSITSVCCVDKKGLLSWPTPTAEKVFFLTTQPQHSPHHLHFDDFNVTKNDAMLEANCHVLNLTQDTRSQHALTFDDNSWENHLSSLKPIGLNILLNCCNSSTVDKYTYFSDHINHLSRLHSKYVPVVNRRCLCELSRQIGFSTYAHKLFRTHEMFGVLNNNWEELKGSDGGGRRYKMPYPNIFVVNVLDMSTGTRQLQSQGTAELLLQQCSHYWDGSHVRVLGLSERKRISDFYQRTSMTSYCTAFAYKPLLPPAKSPETFVIDLPPLVDLSHTQGTKGLLDSNSSRFPSTHNDLHKTPRTSDIEKHNFFGNQVFLGMVTMQYRAVENVVTLIESLESRCIKFVHFSTENELRSRVFSEKMGLEAGWNCHISLLEEDEEEGGGGGGGGDVIVRNSDGGDGVLRSSIGGGGGGGGCGGGGSDGGEQKDGWKVGWRGRSGRRGREVDRRSSLWEMMRHHSVPLLHHQRPSLASPPTTSPSNDGVSPLQHPSHKPADGCYSKNTSLTLEQSIEEINDIQNRAQLPKGIKQIRPHLQHTDNVPLQVSLFTDCTPQTSNQMFDILHEYNEVICCVGSSLSVHNVQAFITADCSFSISPMQPEVCVTDKRGGLSGDGREGGGIDAGDYDSISDMTTLASMMISLPSTMLLRHQHISQLAPLIAMASKHLQKLNCCSKIFFSLLCILVTFQVLTTLLLLPPSITPAILTWMSFLVVPALSLSLIFNPDFSQIPYVQHGQYWEKFIKRTFLREGSFFLLKFIPSLIFILLLFAFNLHHACTHHYHRAPAANTSLNQNTSSTTLNNHSSIHLAPSLQPTSVTTSSLHSISTPSNLSNPFASTNQSIPTCHPFFGASNSSTEQWRGYRGCLLLLPQHIASLQLTILFVIVALSNIHPLEFSWNKSPFKNPCCSLAALAVLIIQIIWFVTDVSMTSCHVTSLSVVTWCLLPVWLVCSCVLHEAVKAKEINIWIRHQKRAKLDFGTKLGMNSPF